jgi:tetratricopeptide (TPR) repeat protein
MVLLAYSRALHAGFIWDDDVYVINNRLLSAPDGLWRIWFSFDSPSQYFPLVYTTLRVEHALWGLVPLGYHLVNILLHGANALLLWRLLARLRIPGAWLAAAIFALHPVQVESVAWVTELKNVQMGFFFLLSLIAWVRFSEEKGRREGLYYGMSLVLYALALFSKTTACTLPAALLVIAWLRGERVGWRKIGQIAPYIVLGIGMGVLTLFWERYHQGTQGRLFSMGLIDRLLVASRGVWFYLAKLFWPTKLTFSYPRWTVSAADPLAYLWLLALCGLGWAAWAARRIVGRSAWLALFFYVATLAPVLGIFMLYTFRYTFVADHYQYLACIGPIVLVSVGLAKLQERWMPAPGWEAGACCAMLLGGLLVLTWAQCGSYMDAETLWRDTIARNPSSWMAHNNLGHLIYGRGETAEAVHEYQIALQIEPTEEAYDNMGNAYFDHGRVEDAVAQYRLALGVNPSDADSYYNLGVLALHQGWFEAAIAQFQTALKFAPTHSRARCGIGNALLGEGRAEEAIVQYNEALRADPDSTEALCNLGNIFSRQGRIGDAIVEYNAALAIDPACANAHYNLGNALLNEGQADAGVAQYRAAVRDDPSLTEASNNLGNILLQEGRIDEAITEFNAALQSNPNYVEAENNLGKALLAEGRREEAIGAIRKALEMQPSNAQIQNNLAWLLAALPPGDGGDGAAAVKLATEASKSTGGNNPIILRTLAAAYAGAGEYPKAIEIAQTALGLAQARSSNGLVVALNKDIKLYRAGQPQRLGE